jgi:hypothetical protein
LQSRTLGRPAIICDEEVEGIGLLANRFNLVDDFPNGIVHPRHHGGEELPLFIADIGKSIEILLWGLKRSMLGIERQVKKLGFVFILVDPVEGSLGIGIGHVKIITGYRLNFVRLAGIDKLSWMKKRSVGERAIKLIEATFGWAMFEATSEVPFSNTSRSIAQSLESIGNRRLVQAQARRFAVPPCP